jgi:hypothetical protein
MSYFNWRGVKIWSLSNDFAFSCVMGAYFSTMVMAKVFSKTYNVEE